MDRTAGRPRPRSYLIGQHRPGGSFASWPLVRLTFDDRRLTKGIIVVPRRWHAVCERNEVDRIVRVRTSVGALSWWVRCPNPRFDVLVTLPKPGKLLDDLVAFGWPVDRESIVSEETYRSHGR